MLRRYQYVREEVVAEPLPASDAAYAECDAGKEGA